MEEIDSDFDLQRVISQIEKEKIDWTPPKGALEAVNSCYQTLLDIKVILGEKNSEFEKDLDNFVFDSFFKDIKRKKLTGEDLEKTFYSNSLGNDLDLSKEACENAILYSIIIACAYASDTVIAYTDEKLNHLSAYYLGKANYYAGIARATITEISVNQTTISKKMKNLATKRHQEAWQKQEVSEREIKQIWQSKNWATYTECAEYIFKQGMFDLSYRKIYELISKK